jgi:PAS domain S-box-containing protein
VLAASLLVTTFATLYVAKTLGMREQLRFTNAVRNAQERIAGRIDTYVAMLRATDGLFSAHYPVFKDEFQRFCAQLDLRNRYPGIQGIGYSFRYDPKGLEGFEGFMRSMGETGFQVHPIHNLDQHYAVVFLEPEDERNKAAIGYDMYSEPVRREAMQRARDTGLPSASGKVQLIQEIDAQKQAGFLIYLPVYKGGALPETVEQRREKIIALVYAPFRMEDLLKGIFASQIEPWLDFEIYDGLAVDPAALLHQTSPQPNEAPYLARTTPLRVAGREWTLQFRTRPEFRPLETKIAIPATAAGGGLLSFALFVVTRAQEVARVRAERLLARLRQSKLALRQSESKFRRLSDANIVGVVFATLDGRIVDGNDEYFRIIGSTRQQILGSGLKWTSLIPPEYRELVDRSAMQLGQAGVSAPYELELIRPSGGRVYVLTGAARLEETAHGIVAMVIDLTQQKEAEKQLLAAKEAAELAQEQAETANRLKDEFLATVSHELRTPLNAILGWTQLLRASRSDPEEVEHGLQVIEKNARAQAQLVDDLLDVSRIVAGKLRVELQPVDLGVVVESAVQTVRPTADVKGVTLSVDVPADRCVVAGDSNRLEQVVWNLLSNAVKFTPRGGHVDVRLHATDEQARITVRDTGRGISRDFLPYVFERFRQADSSSTRKYGGLGLGLGIVRHLVQLHGGTVEAHSAGEDQGSTFTVTLPLSRHALHNTAAAHGNGEASGMLAGLRVLLVEDEADSRELIGRFLTAAGARVDVAESAKQAMQLYENQPPHVLVSDISMPDEDGYTLLRKIRQKSNDAPIPAVAVTAYARPEDRERALAAGYQVHVTKPVQAQDLIEAIARLAGKG